MTEKTPVPRRTRSTSRRPGAGSEVGHVGADDLSRPHLGVLSLVTGRSGRRFDARDLELAEELARRCGTAVDNARLYRERGYIARTLQESLLPSELPEIPGIEAAARFRPTGEGNEMGGDFYDLFATGDRGWTVVVGDVCGKGPDAAAVTALARYTLRAAAMRERLPSRELHVLNEALLRQRPTGASAPSPTPISSRGERPRPARLRQRRPPAVRCCCARTGAWRPWARRARCSAWCRTRASRTARSSWRRATRWCSTPTA